MTVSRPMGALLVAVGVLLVAVSVVGGIIWGTTHGAGSSGNHARVRGTQVGDPDHSIPPPTGRAVPPLPTVSATAPAEENVPTEQGIPTITTGEDAAVTAALGTEIDINCGGLEHLAAAGWDGASWMLVCTNGKELRIASTIGGSYVTAAATRDESRDCSFTVDFPRQHVTVTPTDVTTTRPGRDAATTHFTHGVCRLAAPTKGYDVSP